MDKVPCARAHTHHHHHPKKKKKKKTDYPSEGLVMKSSAPGVLPEDVPYPFRPAASITVQGQIPRSSTASVEDLPDSGPLTEGSETGSQSCGHVFISPSSLTVPGGTPDSF